MCEEKGQGQAATQQGRDRLGQWKQRNEGTSWDRGVAATTKPFADPGTEHRTSRSQHYFCCQQSAVKLSDKISLMSLKYPHLDLDIP